MTTVQVASKGTDSMLKEKIRNKTARYAVVGLGYVGLPLGVEFAKVGIEVEGFEIDNSKVDSLAKGESYIGDVSNEELSPLVECVGCCDECMAPEPPPFAFCPPGFESSSVNGPTARRSWLDAMLFASWMDPSQSPHR